MEIFHLLCNTLSERITSGNTCLIDGMNNDTCCALKVVPVLENTF